ncbi:hypothetical protein [Glutamicibacter arilaitensis]|uniref:hypothetical protein n=1 Tax=Glutamicibacter arilaitensis TaxID=256701 RepID=UPI00384DF8B9
MHLGIFALANQLAHEGRLGPGEHARWRAGNDWFNAAYPNPSLSHRLVYDRVRNPGAAAWFKHGATHLLERVEPYLLLLDAHQIRWERLERTDPGSIIYEDQVQVIAAGPALG